MKPFNKVHSKNRKSQEDRGQYAVMKRNQRKARRRQEHVEDDNAHLGTWNDLPLWHPWMDKR